MSSETQVVTGEVRLSYVHLFEPWKGADGDQDARYNCVVMIPKTDVKTLKALKTAIDTATTQGLPKWGGKKPKDFKQPIKDGDALTDDNPEYEGHYILSVSSKNRPSVVDQNVQPILDPSEVYSGMYARVAIAAWPYNNSGNKGVSFFLNHVQKLRDGEPFGNITRAEDVFEPVDTPAAEEDTDDVLGGLL